MYDKHLSKHFGSYLATLEARCMEEGSTSTVYDIFHEIPDDDLWNILLTLEYSNYPAIRRFLPGLPSDQLQRSWCGNDGLALSHQSYGFYALVKASFSQEYRKPLSSAKILDFGCGWGRLLRYFAKDVPHGYLFGCDPQEDMVEMCHELNIPAIVSRSDYRPRELSFSEKFDLIYAYSVFTHLSEKVHAECLEVIYKACAPNAVVIVTVRPRSYLERGGGALSKLPAIMIHKMTEDFDKGRFVFHPHNRIPIDGNITYGEAVIPYAYIQQNWSAKFDLVGANQFKQDPRQVPVILRKR